MSPLSPCRLSRYVTSLAMSTLSLCRLSYYVASITMSPLCPISVCRSVRVFFHFLAVDTQVLLAFSSFRGQCLLSAFRCRKLPCTYWTGCFPPFVVFKGNGGFKDLINQSAKTLFHAFKHFKSQVNRTNSCWDIMFLNICRRRPGVFSFLIGWEWIKFHFLKCYS